MNAYAVVDILLQMLDGLSAAHKAGLYHRDVKPANTWIRKGEEKVGTSTRDKTVAQLGDWGLAKDTEFEVSEESQRGLTEVLGGTPILGTPRYLAPENPLYAYFRYAKKPDGEKSFTLAKDEEKRWYRVGDIFGAAASAYEALTNECPFVKGDNPQAEYLAFSMDHRPLMRFIEEKIGEGVDDFRLLALVLDKAVEQSRARLVNPGTIPSGLFEIFEQALHVDPRKRFQTVELFAKALKDWRDLPEDQKNIAKAQKEGGNKGGGQPAPDLSSLKEDHPVRVLFSTDDAAQLGPAMRAIRQGTPIVGLEVALLIQIQQRLTEISANKQLMNAADNTAQFIMKIKKQTAGNGK
jgi:serine/threonine protein kinase